MAYLPFFPAVFGSTPTAVLLLGQLSGIAMGLAPVMYLIGIETGRYRQPISNALLGILLYLAIVLTGFNEMRVFTHMIFSVHADAPALAFATMACAIVYGCRQEPTFSRIAWCALFATMAVWAKQIEVGIIPALGAYLWLAFGARVCIRFLILLAMVGTVFSVLVLGLFGVESTLFNILILPSRHPWYEADAPGNNASVMGILKWTWPVMVVLALAIIAWLSRPGLKIYSGRKFMRENPWVLFLIAACFMLPTSILGALKVGGFPNSFHFAHYLALAGIMLFMTVNRQSGKYFLEHASGRLTCGIIVVLLLASIPDFGALNRINRIGENRMTQAWQVAQQFKDEVFFPWMPLSTLLATGNLYHYDYAIWDYSLGGFGRTAESFRENIPAHLRYVVYPSPVQWVPLEYPKKSPPALSYLPECAVVRSAEILNIASKDWVVFACN